MSSHTNRTIYMPVDLMMAFSKHTGLFWSSIEFEGAICDAMAAAMQPLPVQATAPQPIDAAQGYQWKQVFLPEGTMLRASFARQPYFAVVEGGTIQYGQFSLSPSAFANLQGSGNRNAWKAVWLRFPGYKDWVRADECRALRLAASARIFEPDQPSEPDTVEAKPAAPVGQHQQHYADTKPSRDNAIPLFQMLRDFPEDAANVDAATDATPPPLKAAQHLSADAPHPNKKRRHRKASKRQTASRKKR